jgi:hypothetical protein
MACLFNAEPILGLFGFQLTVRLERKLQWIDALPCPGTAMFRFIAAKAAIFGYSSAS